MKKNTATAATIRPNEGSDERANHRSAGRSPPALRWRSASIPIDRNGRASISAIVAASGRNVVTHFTAATNAMANSSARVTSSVDERA